MGKIITYKQEGAAGIFSQIKLNNGERVLISIAAGEIKILKMKFLGNIPAGTVWEYPSLQEFYRLTEAKGYDEMPLDLLVAKVKEFDSVDQLQSELNEFIVNLRK